MYGERIRSLRKEKGMTLRQLATEVNIPFTTLGNYEREDRQPGPVTLNAIADFFDVSVDYLTGRTFKRKDTDHYLAEGVLKLEDMFLIHPQELRTLAAEAYELMYLIFFLGGVECKEVEFLKQTLDFIFRMKRGFVKSNYTKDDLVPSNPYEYVTVFIEEKQELDKIINELFKLYKKKQFK